MDSTHRASTARRPRRPGGARHDPAAVDEAELLDDHAAASAPVLCDEVWLLRARTDCPKCGARTAVYAMLGRPEFETADRSSSLLRRIGSLPAALDKAVREFGRGFWRRDRDGSEVAVHWHSHCHRCHARLGEAFALGPAGPFRPALYKQRIAIKSMRLTGPFVLEDVKRQDSPPLLAWLDWLHRREAAARDEAVAAGGAAQRGARRR